MKSKKFASFVLATILGLNLNCFIPGQANTCFAATLDPEQNIISCTDIFSTLEDSNAVIARAALCDNCGIGTITVSYGSWSSWGNDHQVTCTHYPYGTDMIQARYRLKTLQCTYCGETSVSTVKQTQTICHGYQK